jgi:hypothetical protein
MLHLRTASSSASILCVLGLALAGCTADSSDVATSEIHAEITVDVSDTEGLIDVTLFEGSGVNTSIDLSEGDRLSATTDSGAEIAFSKESGVFIHYKAAIAVDSREVTFKLERASGEVLLFPATLPPVAEIETALTFSRADDDLTLDWSNPVEGAQVTVFVDSCADIEIEPGESKTPIGDSGSFTLPMTEVEAEAGSSADCAQLRLARRMIVQPLEGLHYESFLHTHRYQDLEVVLTP